MVALWFPREELKADLEDQARKRLEEIQREAEKRRNAIVQQAQSGLNDERLQDAMSRFNQMVDPLFDKGRGMIDAASQGVQDTSARAQELVQQAQQGIDQAPTLDAFQNIQTPTPPPTPEAQTPPSPTPGISEEPYTPPPPTPEIPQTPPPRGIDGTASMLSSSFSPPGLPGINPPGVDGTDGLTQPPQLPQLPGPPGFPGLGRPPEGPPGFKPPGLPGLPDTSGLGTALAGRIREGMDAAGQGIGGMAQETGDRMGRNLAGWGDELRGMAGERRDDALEVVNKSLDIAREAVANAEPNLRQTPIGRWAQQEFPRGAIDLVAGPSAAARAAEAIAPWTPEMEREQEEWENVQGQEREGRGLEGLWSGAGRAARRYEQQTREQGETLFGQGTQNENPLERLQAGFGYGMAPYGVLPEVARGGVEEATGSPLAGAAAYGAASILGPGGIAKFLRESGPLALRMARNPAMARQIAAAAGTPATLKALALGLVGGVGGAGFGAKTGVDALRGGSTPQEAAAVALTNAADLLQISEAAGIPIDAGARLLRVFPDLRPRLPSIPGMPSAPEMPGAPEAPRLPTPGEAPPPLGQEGTLTPEAVPDDLGPTAPRPRLTEIMRRAREQAPEPTRPGIGEAAETAEPAVSRARQLEDAEQVADEAAVRAQERQGPPPSQGPQGPLGFLRRFGEELGGAQGQGPQQGVLFGNAPTTEVVGRGEEARRVGAIEQTIGGPAGGRMTGEGAREGGVSLTPARVIPETEISRFGQIRRGAETISPETGALTGTIEDRLLRAYRERDLTADEEKALGVGAPGDLQGGEPHRGGLLGEPRVASFRHPGWMARNYTPDYEAGVMRFDTPDKERMAVEFPTWKPHLRTGSKGNYQYTEIKPKKGQSALDALDEGDDAGTGAPTEKKGTKVLYDTATGEEINITRHPDMPWKQGQMPITDTTGMTRDGRLEERASTPLSYQRAALLRGLGLRNFYPDYGRFFGEDLGRNSQTLFKELNAIFGAVASQASPETNLQRALAVMSAGRHFYLTHGRPPNFNELTILTSTNFDGSRMHYTPTVKDEDLGRFPAGGITGADVKKVIEIWETGGADIGAGWKTPVFGQNLESGALNRADPLSVPDTHMFRGRGHTQTGGGPPQSVNSDLRALGITNATVVRLADEFGLTPFQVQSALWFVYKNELAPFNATDQAQIRNKMAANGTDWNTEAARHDPWPKAMEEGPDGKPRVMTVPGPDGQPMEVRQGTLPAVLRHISNVAGRMPKQVKGQPKVARPRMDLMKAFRDLDAEFSGKVGRDSLTELAGDARLTFNGKLVTNPSRGGTVDLTIPGEGKQRVRSMEITPENIERAAFKASQEAPVAIVPMDGADGEGLGRLGYDSGRGQIEVLREASIPHQVILTNRPFTAGEPGKAETKDTARILFPGASLDTARYAASLLGERVGADEVAVSWPTRQGAGRPVVSVEHPEGLEWTTEEIAKYPWASDLVGRANVSPDGRTLFFADLKPEEAKTVPWAERVQAVLEDAGVPPELVRRTADFGIERVGAEQYGDVLSRAPLQSAGELGQRAQAQFEAGEAVPGSTPTAANLREYAGPERFRPEGAPVGSLGIREGARSPLRDTLDERLQIGQGLLGAAVGAKEGEEYDEEDEGLQRAGRILGGGLGGAIVGVNAPNARRLLRAAQRAGAGDALRGVRRFGAELAGDEAGRLGAVSKGPPSGDVPRRGELRGEEMGLGDLEDPENLTRLLINPPEGLTGEQINEIGRAAFKRLRTGITPEQTAQQREAERGRRLVRRQEGIQKVEQATTPEEVADAAADAQEAAQQGEMPHSDADAVRGRAARKLQQRKGADGPPEPGEMDRQIEASKARREAEKVTEPTDPTREQEREGLGVERPQEEYPRRVEDPYEDVEAGGALTPEDDAAQRAYIERERARNRPGPLPEPLPPPVGGVDTPPPEGEPHLGRGPELGPSSRAVELGPAPARVTSGSKAERDQAAARAKYLRRPSARVEATSPVTSLETEAALAARATEPAERGIPRLVAPDGTFLTRAQVAAQMARDAARPGGWGAIRDEWNEGLSDAARLLAAAGRGIKVAPQEFDRALAQVGRGLRGAGSRERWEGLPQNARGKLTSFRPEHIFDAMGTYQRINMVVTPEGFGRNFLSTTVALPLRFYEAATAPLFDRMWGVLPAQGDRGADAAHSYEAVAMAEGLYRSWAAGIANAMNVTRKGDERLTRAQTGDDAGDFQNTRMGKAMGTLFRPMTATDAFLKTLNEGMEAYRLSYRQAKNEFDAGKLRHDGRSIRSRMIEIMSVPDQKFIDQVQQAGEYNTYNQKAGRLANLMEGFKNLPEGTPAAVAGVWKLLMNTVIPFVRISTNVMKFGLERTIPGGLVSTAMGQGRQDRSERFAKMTEGALMLGGLWGAQQAGLIEVSGALPEDDTEREEWELQGKTPYSVRVGDRWYNPQAFPGLMENVTMLGMMGDTKRKVDEKEAAGEEVGLGDYLSEIPGGAAQYLGQVGVRPAFGSVVNLLGAMTARGEGQRQYYRNELQRSAIGQAAPASGLMRQIGNLTDTTQRTAETAGEQLAAIYPWWRENLPAKTNARGQEMESESYKWPLAGLTSSKEASDTTMPRKYRGSKSAQMDREITRAIEAVNAYADDRKANPRPTSVQRRLATRYKGRLNPRRKALDEKVTRREERLAESRRRAQVGGYADSPFAFQIPGRFRREEEEVA